MVYCKDKSVEIILSSILSHFSEIIALREANYVRNLSYLLTFLVKKR